MADSILRRLEDGYRSQRAGDAVRAEQVYSEVLGLEPGNVHALNLLGALCVNEGRPAEAVGYLTRALAVAEHDAQTHANLGLACKDLGRLAEAELHLCRAVEIDPGNPVFLNNLGNVQRLLDRPAAAVASYEAALRLQPEFADCWSNLAAAFNDNHEYRKGLAAVDRALRLNPRLPQAWNNRGELLLSEARHPEAIDSLRRAVELDPGYAAALVNIARVQRDMNAPEDALATLDRVFELQPENPQARHVQGVLREQMGDRDGAAECFRAAIRTSPEMTIAHYHLAQIKGRRSTDAELAAMMELWERADLAPGSRMYVAYGLYRALEQRGEYDRAFEFLAAGNRIKAESRPYDDAEATRYMDSIVEAAQAAIARSGRVSGHDDPRPVFVLGMPRSGTSLTEQILASHSEVAGAGELSYAYDTARRSEAMAGRPFPQALAALSETQLGELGRYYMSRHTPADLAAARVVDKTPLNFQYLGLLALALPRARFVHCHRDPVANCFAIHRMPFDQRQTYAHDLAALGRYYRRYRALMERWHALFPGRILDVRYEDTVANLEQQSRSILDFLGLPFEAGVLRYYETRRLVKTPSASQVRDPIYSDSVDAWRRYERHLGPLLASLGPLAAG
jgi:tetratricopeptide (TPR) repeat protein